MPWNLTTDSVGTTITLNQPCTTLMVNPTGNNAEVHIVGMHNTSESGVYIAEGDREYFRRLDMKLKSFKIAASENTTLTFSYGIIAITRDVR